MVNERQCSLRPYCTSSGQAAQNSWPSFVYYISLPLSPLFLTLFSINCHFDLIHLLILSALLVFLIHNYSLALINASNLILFPPICTPQFFWGGEDFSPPFLF